MVAVPDVVGVHWKTRSGARPEIPHVPASVLVPLVVPVKVPPPAGMTVALPQAAPARVVEVVLEGAAGGVAPRAGLPPQPPEPAAPAELGVPPRALRRDPRGREQPLALAPA